jgi:nucleoid DNA-binding protein
MVIVDYRNPIIQRAARRAGLGQVETSRIASAIFEAVRDELAQNKGVDIRGLGKLRLKYRHGRGRKRWDLIQKKVVPREGYWAVVFHCDRPMRSFLKANKHKL